MRWIAVGVLFVMLVLLAVALSYGARQLRGDRTMNDVPAPSPQAADPFSNYPALRTGNIGVAKDGSVWMTAANAMTMVAPAGTIVHPDLVGAQQTAAEEPSVHDDDAESEHHRSRRRR